MSTFRRAWQLRAAKISIVILAAIVVLVAFGHLLAPMDPLQQHDGQILKGPSAHFWLGTDYLGRDVLSRLIYGSTLSVLTALEAVGIAFGLGVLPGLASVYLGRPFEWVSQRVMDGLMALPFIIFAIAVAALLGNGLHQAMFAVGVLMAPGFFRITRAAAWSFNRAQYVEAAQLLGASPWRIIRKHIWNKVLPTVVEIKTQQGEGSGFIVSSDGQIITNNHVIADAVGGGAIEVDFQNGKTAQAKIIGRDPTTDVAVIKAQSVSGLPTATLGTSSSLQIGQQVVAIGSPFDLAGTVTSGIVSSLHRPVNVGDELTPQSPQGQSPFGQQQQQPSTATQQTVLDAIQTDAAINPGNSGGPLVNMQGQVIGMNSAISSPSSSAQSQGGSVGIGFSIPVDQAKRTAQQIIQTGKATQAQLGVSVTDTQNGSGGATIKDVTAGGAAEKAGIKAGDVVTKLNDRVITSADSLVAAVHAQASGDNVTLTLSSGKTVQATLTGNTIDVQN